MFGDTRTCVLFQNPASIRFSPPHPRACLLQCGWQQGRSLELNGACFRVNAQSKGLGDVVLFYLFYFKDKFCSLPASCIGKKMDGNILSRIRIYSFKEMGERVGRRLQTVVD